MHDSAYEDARGFVEQYLRDELLQIADIGSCDVNGTLRPLLDNPHWQYTGFDIAPGPNVDRVLSGEHHWPEIESNTFDVVVSTQVLEHVRRPWRWLAEIARITKPGGIVYICTPNTIEFHEHPVDCWRAWPEGLRAIAEDAGLSVEECYANGIDTTLIAFKE